jgi:hypothetical protein
MWTLRAQACTALPALIGARLHIIERDVLVDKVADGLYPRPSWWHIIEKYASEVFQVAGHFTVAASQ